MKKIRTYYLCLIAIGLFISCNEDSPIDKEQYFKQIYIVGASDVIKTYDVSYGDGPQSTYISVATGGSLNIDKDVTVKLTHNDATIDWYNKKYMIDSYMKYRRLDPQYYDIPSMNVAIKTGEVYARLPFTVNSSMIDPDSLYALTFKIESVSQYQKVTKDTVLIMNLNMVNEYSGTYQMLITKYTIDASGQETMPTSISISRKLKAVDKNSVRFFNEITAETTLSYPTKDAYFAAIDNSCIVFEYNESEKAFKVKGWKNFNVTDGSATFYNDVQTEKKRFEFSYDYVVGSTTYRVKGKLER